jgi:hypothetical protein
VRTLERIYLAANLLIFGGFAAAFFAAPDTLGGLIGITLRDNTARADFRAMYGGLSLGVGVVLALGLTKPRWREPALLLGVTTAAGLALGRLLTLATHGPAGLYIEGSLASELISVITGIVLLRVASPAPSENLSAA